MSNSLHLIKQAFQVFDTANNQTCDVREVGTILRSLNKYVSEEVLHSLVRQMEENEPTGYIQFEKFEKVLKSAWESIGRDDNEKIYQAFKVLDKDKKGFLMPEDLQNILTTDGEIFGAEEMEEMLTACVDPIDGRIYYEDYANTLAT